MTQCQFDTSGRLVTCHATAGGEELGAYSQKLSALSPSDDGSDISGLNRYERMAELSPTVDNLLMNHSCETASYWTSSSSVGESAFVYAVDDEISLYGNSSFRLYASGCEALGRARFYQDVNTSYITPNKTYTASAYIRTDNIIETNGQENGGAALLVFMKAASLPTSDDPEAADSVSEYITGTTDVKVADGWRRVSVTFTTPSDIQYVRINGMIRGATGTAWFDGIRLEEGDAPSAYNMIENGGMERVTSSTPDGWSRKNMSTSDSSSSSYRFGSVSFMIKPDASLSKELYQDVPVNGNEKDTYVISGWSKGTGVLERSDQSERKYKISVQVIYSDGTSKWKTPAEFTYAVGEWKYAATSFNLGDGTSAAKTPVKVRVCLRSHGQANTVYYDGIQMTRRDIDQCTYDDDGNLKKSGNTTYTYDNGLPSTVTDSTGSVTTYTYYTGTSRLYKVSTSTGKAVNTYSYDEYGNVTGDAYKISDTYMKILTQKTYDDTGTYVMSSYDEHGYESSWEYNDRGLVESFTDANGTSTTYTYDSSDRPVSVSEGDIGHEIVYGDNGMISSVDAGGTVYSFDYDEFGNMTEARIGAQTISTNTYGEYNGMLETSLTNNGTTCDYGYDERGNLIKVRRNGYLVYHIIYNREGTLHESRDYASGKTTRYRYDYDGRVVGADVYTVSGDLLEDRWIYGMETGYDEHGRIIRMILKGTDASYCSDITYTDSGKISSETVAGRETKYSYDELERTTKKRIVIDEEENRYLDTTYAYRTSDRGSAFTTNQLEAERVAGVRYEYEYDRNGNIISVNRVDSMHNGKVIYVYDSHDQLIREDSLFSETSISYVYDTNGNLKTRTVSEYQDGVTGDVISEERYNYGSLISGDRLTKINDEAVTYDGTGNPLNMDGWTLTWNGRRLTSMTKDDDVISFGYDSQGRRISRTVNGEKTRYFYVGDTVTGEDSASSGRIAYIYDSAGRISALTRTYNGETDTYHLMTNSRGDVEAVYTDEGEMIVRYIYDAYGNEISREYGSDSSLYEIADINPFRYRGYMYDEETQLFYCNSRYYSPELCRWISPDSIEYLDPESINGMNLYCYCANNPIMNIDPSGHAWYNPLTWDWGEIAKGVGLGITGVGAIAVGIVTLPYGGWIAAVAGITFIAGGGTTLFGMSDIGEGITDYNVIQEAVFIGNEDAYNLNENIFKYTAIAGTAICGIYGSTHTTLSSARNTPRTGSPHSAVYNKQFNTLTYYGKNCQMKYSMHLFNRGHQWIHWHTELPHSQPINNYLKFIWEMAKRGF